jgi:acyl carrier protein
MNTLNERLSSCFANVFPELSASEIPQASMERLDSWDSLAHVTLLSSIAEEFGQPFEVEDFESLTSYSRIAENLEKKAGNV